MTPLELLALRLEMKGYVVLELRQPIPSEKEPGIVSYCERAKMRPGYNGIRRFHLATLDEGEDLDRKVSDSIREMETCPNGH